MSKVLLSTMAGLGAAGIGGGIYLANKGSETKIEKETIQAKLVKDKYTPLNSSDPQHQAHWQTSLGKYKEEYKNQTEYTEEKLKALCNDLFNKEDIDTSDYKVAKKYCVVPRKISERLKDIEFTALDTSGTKSEVTEKWKKLSAEYKKNGTGDRQLDSVASVDDANGDALKNGCKTVLEKEHWDSKYDSLLENAKTWCTEEGFKKLPAQ
ncbi:hypothetical protein HF1_08710 [Mycoplasma haemofelis str. Langford 1]|uniref:Uncharacterized protein n=1 Tax=Mycoplasma haemofelis (strain Langford 1) TaxID=941640 RepID=E8ZIA8_MYCHL|nr:hypothetical protein [Mycoplasma haemofelis]CBY92879.1 hypothetical protein HF1_08710 [Mycoplasma haemofelis str. Langford 1]